MPIPQVNDRIKEAPVVVLRAVFAGIGQILLTADKVRARAAEQGWADRATALAPRPLPGPRNWITHAEPRAASREAAATSGTATATRPPAATPGETGTTLAGSLPSPSSGAGRQPKARPTAKATRVAPATKSTPAAKATAPATRATPATKAAATPATKSTPAAKAAAPTAGKTAAPAAKAAPAKAAPAKAAPAAKPTKTVPAPRSAKAEPATPPPLPGWDDISLASLRARLRGLDPAAIRGMLAYEQAHARREPVITMLERRLAKITAG